MEASVKVSVTVTLPLPLQRSYGRQPIHNRSLKTTCMGRDGKTTFMGRDGKTIQYNTISFIADNKNKDREVSADKAATETYYMMGIIKNLE